MKYKIAETFFSLQGEGHWTGTPMLFVRLSQCPVGKTDGICKTWDGREFICDTGRSYRQRPDIEFHPYTEVNRELDAKTIWKLIPRQTKHLCLTGGEPLVYNLSNMVLGIPDSSYTLHIETSGTIYQHLDPDVWVTVSPKIGIVKGMVDRADEIKLLVDRATKISEIQKWIDLKGPEAIHLQPIESKEWVVNRKHTVEMALTLGVNLSLQTHKMLEIR